MSDIAFSVIVNNNGIDDIIFKTIMVKGEKGNSIASVEKTGTSGKVDTYTIYLTDGTVGGTFTVTNGEDGAPVNIDDTVIALDKTWSSSKLSGMIKEIDDTNVDSDKLWSSQKINSITAKTGTIENVEIASFSDGADDVPVSELIVAIEAVQAGSGTPSPSNVRPISGWSECNIHKSGANLWDEQWEVGDIDNTTGATTPSSNFIRSKEFDIIKPSTQYCVSLEQTSVFFYDVSKAFISRVLTSNDNQVITTPSNARFFKIKRYGTTYINNISINYPSTDIIYRAYNGGIDTIDLGGTYYGGVLDVTSGVAHITHTIVDMGEIDWFYREANGIFFATLSNKKPYVSPSDMADLKCELFKYGGSAYLGGVLDDLTIYNRSDASIPQTNNLLCKWSIYSDKTNFINAVTGYKLVYELNEPITIQLTPTQVRTISQQNNIFADTGDVDELIYFKTGSEAVARLIEAYLRGE